MRRACDNINIKTDLRFPVQVGGHWKSRLTKTLYSEHVRLEKMNTNIEVFPISEKVIIFLGYQWSWRKTIEM